MSGSDEAALLEALDTEGMIAFAQRLVKIRSVNDSGQGSTEEQAALAIADQMHEFGWDPTIEYVAHGRPNVVAEVIGEAPGRSLLFEGHTDVVFEGDPTTWSFDPYSGEIIDGRLLGRGSADMKSGVAAMIFATRALQLSGSLVGRIVVAALVDEEELMIGVKHFVASGQAAGIDGAIVCEPEAGEICHLQKGAIRLQATVTGVMAHGAMPDRGNNPIPPLMELAARLQEEQRVRQLRLGTDRLLGNLFITPTVVRAGDRAQLNVIPPVATMAWDLRTIPGVDHPELLDTIRNHAAKIASSYGVTVELEVIDDRPPTETSLDSPVVRALAYAVTAVTKEVPRYGGVPGTTDGTILWRDAKLPVAVFGPGGKWIAHQVDEYVEVSDVIEAAKIYTVAANRFLRGL
ncbi:MAG: M20 family metallopeptidase [Ferrimicrobium sp.]